ncbi:cold-shock protein [Ralstonia solanacearum]|uniref:CSD domain-containing protein n=1 Tax=Ralstonia syzygii TaxID=28097 RepID=A0ABX7ZD98_9RALS|nr:cold-shock protein [Ralstonia solanacearum]QUP52907.1 hypothetical protein GO998_03625 [Ralstonia syzygii]AXV85478.1 cold-shock protein [Ralstonia solanacearum]AXV90117.1 cold-shock protein [Ralstonia solanacearum]AXW04990.1 cold-shock protein [Ralstonia solanacearum]
MLRQRQHRLSARLCISGEDGFKTLEEGQRVSYIKGTGQKGPTATKIQAV